MASSFFGTAAVEVYSSSRRLGYVKDDVSFVKLPKKKSKVNTYRDGKIITASKLRDLATVPERRAHHNGVVAMSLVVVEDALHALDTGVLSGGKVLLQRSLVPVQDAADKGGDQERASLSGGDGLDDGEHQGEVAVDAMLGLEFAGGLDTFPGRGDFDEDAVLADALLFIELGVCSPSATGPT
jgi:hypothetical protein